MNKKGLELLKEYCNGDKDRLDFLERSIATKDVIIEDDGNIKYSSKYILGDKELQVKTMPPEYVYLDIKVGVINLINLNTDCEVKDGDAVVEKLSKFIVKNIITSIKNNTSEEYWETLGENQITFCIGPAGVGKSHIAMKKAVDLLWEEDNKYEKIIIVRPAVEAEEKLGSLPGGLEEKLDPYIFPSYYLLNKIIGKEAREKLKEAGFIEVVALGYMRGWNVDNTILVFEEAQNATPKQIKLLVTRIGYNAKFFISGDLEQSDKFNDITKSGLYDGNTRLNGIKGIGNFEFFNDDIVRNPIIGEILKKYN